MQKWARPAAAAQSRAQARAQAQAQVPARAREQEQVRARLEASAASAQAQAAPRRLEAARAPVALASAAPRWVRALAPRQPAGARCELQAGRRRVRLYGARCGPPYREQCGWWLRLPCLRLDLRGLTMAR